MTAYEALSIKIARLRHQDNVDKQDALKTLLMQRAMLLNRASNKLKVLSELVG